jgi:4-hydroxy-3-polyprenylbenzoate decarboxylase
MNDDDFTRTLTVAWTGASGFPYGLRLLEMLLAARVRVWLLYTSAAQIVAKQELGLTLPAQASALEAWLLARFTPLPGQLRVFGQQEWFAPMASGSNPGDAMIVCPCTMGALAAIAHGMADNLLERAADVMLKERRPLILVPRETPFSAIHLEHMLKLARLGVVILPPNPAFYHHPQQVSDLVDFVVARILDHVQVPHQLMQRWGAQWPVASQPMSSAVADAEAADNADQRLSVHDQKSAITPAR